MGFYMQHGTTSEARSVVPDYAWGIASMGQIRTMAGYEARCVSTYITSCQATSYGSARASLLGMPSPVSAQTVGSVLLIC
mmetsp:Transcript_16178/g.49131  ORF Transcript_16178/g.49131 Transcript_16178/m.49131 type:complete len:80 (-) Transcript_16178:132-371(-)|eukprot:scaffold189130_cov39-Tisochrysis_lutea.AAC.2